MLKQKISLSQLPDKLSQAFGGKKVKLKGFVDKNGKLFEGEDLNELIRTHDGK